MIVYIVHYYADGKLVEAYYPTRFEAGTFSRFAFTLSADEGSFVTLFEGSLKNIDLIKLLCHSLNGVIVVASVSEIRRWRVPDRRSTERWSIMDAYIENKDEENGRIIQSRGM